MKQIFVLTLLFFSYPSFGFSHEDIEKIEITCSSNYTYYSDETITHVVTPSWSYKFVKSHFTIPDKGVFRISLEVHFQDGKVIVGNLKMYSKDGNPYRGDVLDRLVTLEEYNLKRKVDKCYLVL